VIIRIPPKRTERALGRADIRVVDVPVDDIRPQVVAMQRPGASIRVPTKALKVRLQQKPQPLLRRQPGFSRGDRLQKAWVRRGEIRMLSRLVIDAHCSPLLLIQFSGIIES
jgi:hypothetical protein